MTRDFESGDEGKPVVTADGERVGTIERSTGPTAEIMPESDLSQSIRRRLGWSEGDQETYELERTNVESIAGDEVTLKENR